MATDCLFAWGRVFLSVEASTRCMSSRYGFLGLYLLVCVRRGQPRRGAGFGAVGALSLGRFIVTAWLLE